MKERSKDDAARKAATNLEMLKRWDALFAQIERRACQYIANLRDQTSTPTASLRLVTRSQLMGHSPKELATCLATNAIQNGASLVLNIYFFLFFSVALQTRHPRPLCLPYLVFTLQRISTCVQL